jgi:hypothetical protein
MPTECCCAYPKLGSATTASCRGALLQVPVTANSDCSRSTLDIGESGRNLEPHSSPSPHLLHYYIFSTSNLVLRLPPLHCRHDCRFRPRTAQPNHELLSQYIIRRQPSNTLPPTRQRHNFQLHLSLKLKLNFFNFSIYTPRKTHPSPCQRQPTAQALSARPPDPHQLQ